MLIGGQDRMGAKVAGCVHFVAVVNTHIPGWKVDTEESFVMGGGKEGNRSRLP
jgi:hypothetical protein